MTARQAGDWYSDREILPSQPVPHSKAPDMSQVFSQEPAPYQPKQRLRDESSEFVRLARAGGHKDLLRIQPNMPTQQVQHDMPADWYYQHGQDPAESFSRGDMEEPLRSPTSSRFQQKEDDSEYVKLAKKGGHSDLLVIEENKKTSKAQPYNRSVDWYYLEDNKGESAPNYTQKRGRGTSNPALKNDTVDAYKPPQQSQQYHASQPIWLGGSGPEISHVPGKRFAKKEQQEAPFALHSTTSATRMSRNPDKI